MLYLCAKLSPRSLRPLKTHTAPHGRCRALSGVKIWILAPECLAFQDWAAALVQTHSHVGQHKARVSIQSQGIVLVATRDYQLQSSGYSLRQTRGSDFHHMSPSLVSVSCDLLLVAIAFGHGPPQGHSLILSLSSWPG